MYCEHTSYLVKARRSKFVGYGKVPFVGIKTFSDFNILILYAGGPFWCRFNTLFLI